MIKRTYLAVALLACGVSGVASATTNYAQATTTLNVSQETQMTIYGNPALMNLQSASTGTSATASDASQTISNTRTLTSCNIVGCHLAGNCHSWCAGTERFDCQCVGEQWYGNGYGQRESHVYL